MLKKSLKHEWKATWKGMAGINGAALALGLLGSLGVIGAINNLRIPDLIIGLYVFAYVLILIASSVVTYFMMASRFYKSIFTDEGYLTNTLPITADQKLLSRFLIFLAWILINILCIVGSIAFLLTPLFAEALQQTGGTMELFQKELGILFDAIARALGFSNMPMMVLFLTAVSLISLVYFILSVYFCISMGSLFSSHRILAAVLIYFGLSMIMQVLMSGFTFFEFLITSAPASVFSLTLLLYSLAELVLAVAFYFSSRYIITHKLNLQ